MSERQQRASWWVSKLAVAMAALAALALAVTVLLARHALDDAAEAVIRGDGDTLVSGVVVDFWESEGAPTAAKLAEMLTRHEAQRLRYVALVDRDDHHVLAEAGAAAIARPFALPGEVVRQGRRVRLVALIPPPWETRAAARGAPRPALSQRPYLALEFEPPLIQRLQKDLTQIAIVAGAAAVVLVVLALAWSRTLTRLTALERQAERERRLVALGRASSVIAHELRNPLAGLKGHAQLLAEDLAGPSRAKAARVVQGAERLEQLTTVLLDFVRDAPVALGAIAPGDLVDRALASLATDRVRVDSSAAPAHVEVDVERMSLALRNLVQNALQATSDATQPVEVRVFTEAQDAVIEVRDHGPGLAEGARAHMFEPFVTTKTRGTGLGLSIAKRIAEQHLGTLTGETHRDGGAVFRLAVPLHPQSTKVP